MVTYDVFAILFEILYQADGGIDKQIKTNYIHNVINHTYFTYIEST